MVKSEWFRTFSLEESILQFQTILQSWDTANKPGELSDFSVCTTWGIIGKHLYLLHVYRKRVDYPELKRAVREQADAFHAKVILIEDRASGTQLLQELVHEGVYGAQSYKPTMDNRRLALSGIVTQAWDVENSRMLADISPPFGGSTALSFSDDGNWVATADGDGHVRVFDAATGKPRSTGTEFVLEPLVVAFSRDNKSVIAGGVDRTLSIIDPETGKVLRTLPKQPGLIISLDVSADKKQVAVIYGSADYLTRLIT